jgi:hypothetical protein|tara:strand:+ start:253 stop:483 length:231 start_codon:yes stop_codon:yes gene_type:complete
MDEIKLSWGQYWSFTKGEIYTAVESVLTIKSKILQLETTKEKVLLEEDKKILQKKIDRLEMSKECIKHYYKIELNL